VSRPTAPVRKVLRVLRGMRPKQPRVSERDGWVGLERGWSGGAEEDATNAYTKET
jgi:hypothetical protein